jgi:hypothetical protein
MKTENKEVRTETFGVRLSPTEIAQLETLAETEDRTPSDMLRMCFIREFRARGLKVNHRKS